MDKWNKCHLEIKYIMRMLYDIRLNIISKFPADLECSILSTIQKISGICFFFIHCRAATGSKAAKAWSLARFKEVENNSGSSHALVKWLPLWRHCLTKICCGAPAVSYFHQKNGIHENCLAIYDTLK